MGPTDNISQPEFERIERYILDSMTQADKQLFESELQNNPDLRIKYTDIKAILQEIELSALKEKMEEFHQEMGHVPVMPIQKAHGFSWKYIGIAASLLLFLSFSIWILISSSTENEKLYTTYYQSDPGLVTAMGSSSQFEFDRGMVDYKTGKYQEAIDRWEILLEERPTNDTLNFFLGSSYLAMNLAEASKPYFEITSKSENSLFQNEAFWYLGLAALKTGDIEAAKNFIKKSNREEAAELLHKLEK